MTDTPGLERLTDTAKYVVNMDLGRIHRRFLVGTELADFPRCNLDQIAMRREFDNREEAVAALGRITPKPCKRCFPGPTAEERAASADNMDEAPPGDPQAAVVSVSEMDPEDIP